jgi:hypothetical protein
MDEPRSSNVQAMEVSDVQIHLIVSPVLELVTLLDR